MALPDNPLTRVEQYLNRIATGSGTIPDEPLTRVEQYLAYIAENGSGGGGSGVDNVARRSIGTLSNLDTTDKSNLVAAINEVLQTAAEDAQSVLPTDTASGAIASFPDGAEDAPVKSLVAQIAPVQSGSGDPSPTNIRPITGFTGCKVRRTGKNLFDASTFPTTTLQGVTCTNNGDGSFTINGTATIELFFDLFRNQFRESAGGKALPSATYRLTGIPATTPYGNNVFLYATPNYTGDYGSGVTFTSAITGGSLCIQAGTTVDNLTIWPMIRLASDGDDTFEPYQGDTYNIAFPSEAGTVYGGTLDLTNGVLNVTRGFIASYNGETLPGEWISSMDVYTQGGTPTTGAQVCYDLASPATYQLTPTEVKTLLGVNNIWADTGDVAVDYRADTGLYIQKLTGSTEEDMIADAPIASGKYFLVGNTLYLSTAAIAAGATLTPGTNCVKTNLAEALNALNS